MSVRHLKRCLRMPYASVASSSIILTQSWLIFIIFLSRLDYRDWHRFALVVTETRDVQNALDVSFMRGRRKPFFSSLGGNCTVTQNPSNFPGAMPIPHCFLTRGSRPGETRRSVSFLVAGRAMTARDIARDRDRLLLTRQTH